MKAWLITWEWIGEHAEVRDPLIAIFGSRKSTAKVADFVEQHYLLSTSAAHEVAYFANRQKRIPYRVSTSEMINSVSHCRITCGHNPFIYARGVSNLVIEFNHDSGKEVLRWVEPPIYKWADNRRSKPILDRVGRNCELTRDAKPMIHVI